MVGWVSSRLILACLGWKKDPHMKCPVWINNKMILMSYNKNSLGDPWITAHKTVWWLPCFLCGLGQFQADFGCVWDERRVQMSGATHRMDSMDPQKNDNDELQTIQSFGSTENTQNYLINWTMFSVCAGSGSVPGWFWVCLGWKKGLNESSYTSNGQYGSTKE